MAAKHAQHEMREDKNFKDVDTSEISAQSLYYDQAYNAILRIQIFTYNANHNH